VEEGHIAYQAGDYDTAAQKYQTALDKLSEKSSLVPLVRYSLAKAHESKGDWDKALNDYRQLAETSSFAGEAYLAMGRIYQRQGKPEKEKEAYRKIVDGDLLSGSQRTMVEEKLSALID